LQSTALRSAANAIVITDCEGRIVWTNPAFTRLTGYTEAEAIGQYPRVLKSGRQDRPFYEEMWNTVLAGKTWRGELINRRKDGSLYTEDMTITPVLDDAGNVTNFVAIKQDISEQKAAETQRIRSMALESERNHLRDAVKAHERVLGVVGHELRTPLAGIRAMSEFLLLDDVRESEEFDVFVRSINDELARMANLVNDLVEVSRLNSGTANWNWGEVNVHEVCHEALDGVRTLVDHARVRLSLQVDPPHLMMSGDAGGIRRLLVNLLSNAHKNTSQGSISLRARRIERGGRSWLELTITDTGSGMTPEVAKRLGEAFALNSGVVGESHVKGSGLGLAICKGIAAAHGGTIHVATTEGEGTTLTVRLRMDLDQPEVVGQAAEIVAEVRS
ncbi:MAG: nitrogen regulation protein NR(II), partial [Dehalococcoidia bacterium]